MDDDWRELERRSKARPAAEGSEERAPTPAERLRWAQTPEDAQLVERLVAALVRADRPLPRALVDAAVEPARTLRCDAHQRGR